MLVFTTIWLTFSGSLRSALREFRCRCRCGRGHGVPVRAGRLVRSSFSRPLNSRQCSSCFLPCRIDAVQCMSHLGATVVTGTRWPTTATSGPARTAREQPTADPNAELDETPIRGDLTRRGDGPHPLVIHRIGEVIVLAVVERRSSGVPWNAMLILSNRGMRV